MSLKAGLKIPKKTLVMILSVFLFTFALPYFAPDLAGVGTAEAATLKDSIKANSTTTLTSTVNNAGTSVVKLARDIAFVVLIVLIIWMGYSLWVKKTAEGLADMKGRLAGLLLAVAFVFMPEKILGAIFGIFGITIT